jgi:hypothetical protein
VTDDARVGFFNAKPVAQGWFLTNEQYNELASRAAKLSQAEGLLRRVKGGDWAYLSADIADFLASLGTPEQIPEEGHRLQVNPEPLRVTETKPGALRCAKCKRDSRNCRCYRATFEILQEDGTWK